MSAWTYRSNAPAARRHIRTGLADGATAAGEHLLDVSNTRVPRESGALEASGEVVADREKLRAAVTYGTTPETAAYATIVHEDLTAHHDVGQAKFLESAFGSERRDLLGVAARAARRRIP